MPKTIRQAADLARTARSRNEIERTIRHSGFEGMLAEVGGFTAEQFSAARHREGGVIPVIIPAHNEGGPKSDLPATLLSLARAEAYPVVMNNRSTDNTAEIAARMGATVIDVPQGRKMAATKAGITFAREELGADRVLFTDADTLVPPRWAGSMSLALAGVEPDQGSAVFGGSIKWHGPSMAADSMLSAKGYAADRLKLRRGNAPTAHGHNYGLQFDAGGQMEAAINSLPSDLFVEQGRADDALIAEAVTEAGAVIMGPAELDQYVLTRGDRVTSLRAVVDLTLHRTTYNELVLPSYQSEYPDL